MDKNVGLNADSQRRAIDLFGERACSIIVSCRPENEVEVRKVSESYDMRCLVVGITTAVDEFWLASGKKPAVFTKVSELRAAFSQTLPTQLAAEVVTA